MITNMSMWIGVFLLAIGIFGFIPGITSDNVLLGVFTVGLLHNMVYIVTGGLGIWAAKDSARIAASYLKTIGIVYVLMALFGFFTGRALIVAMPVAMMSNILHIVVAAIALCVSFMKKDGAFMTQSQSAQHNSDQSP